MEQQETVPAIAIRSLSKTFFTKHGEFKALDGIDLNIEKGEIFGIIGMSGAGKSTLVRCINYLEKPTEGDVLINGNNLSLLNNKELRRARQSMGMIFQQFNLLMQKTVEKNVRFPLEIANVEREQAHARVKELLELVGLSDKAKSYPSQLSGGQKQRVAIARALATSPDVLLCDEATSALDPNTTRSILALLKDINQRMGITIVIITHEMSVIEEICTKVAIIDNSRIAEVGKVEDIFVRPRTEAAQRLVYPEDKSRNRMMGTRCCRVVFDGSSAYDPVIADVILACKAPVNILYADMKDIDGKAFGQMVMQLPVEEDLADRVVKYLKAKNLTVEEVNGYVG